MALVALALGLGGINEAAAISLPGDVLYPVKIAAADLRLRLEFGAGQRLRLESLYAEQRLEDVRRLLALGREVPISFHGQVQVIGTVLWQVQEIPVRLTPRTRVVGEILPGMLIEVEGVSQADGTVLADEIHLESYDTLGTLAALDAERMIVDGRAFLLTPRSVLDPGLAVGQRVLVRMPPPPSTSTPAASPTDDHSGPGGGTPGPGEDDDGPTETPATQEGSEDDREESEKIQFEGVVQSIAGSQWVVDGRTIRVDGQTEIQDNPGVGDTVKVVAFLQSDGTWWAQKIERED